MVCRIGKVSRGLADFAVHSSGTVKYKTLFCVRALYGVCVTGKMSDHSIYLRVCRAFIYTRVHRGCWLGAKRQPLLQEGYGAVAKSLDHSRHQRRLRWLRWQGRSSRPYRQIDGGVIRQANPERCASRAKQTAPLPG